MKSEIPQIASVDVLIVGSSTSAAAAAIAAKAKGLKAFVLSDRSYLGEETAGVLRWNSAPDALFRATFPTLEAGEPRPGAYKHAIEKRLLEENIPFLYFARPVAFYRGEDGVIAGMIFAYRTTLYAIEAKTWVDMSRHGHLAHLAKGKEPQFEGRQYEATLNGVTLAGVVPPHSTPIGEPFISVGENEQATVQLQQWRTSAATHSGGIASIAGLEHRLRAQIADAAILLTADALAFKEEGCISGVDVPDDLRDDDFRMSGRFWTGYASLPLSPVGYERLQDSNTQVALGLRLGRLVAKGGLEKAGDEAHTETPGSDRRVRIAKPFLRESVGQIEFDLSSFPVIARCDVLVAGGGTAGASAGIGAVRQGAKTIVIEMQRGLGGVGTLGTIACYWFGNKFGFTEEIDKALGEMDPANRPSQWNPEVKMAWYNQQLLAAGGEAWYGTFAFGVHIEEGHVKGVLVSTPFGPGLIEAGCVIDASGCCDIADAAGAPCRVIQGDHVALQGSGLSPRVLGTHYINSDFDFIDDTDLVGITHAFVNARAKFSAKFDTIPFLNTRERRQIVGDFELSPLDILAHRRFPDVVNLAMSNFDSHGFTIHPVFTLVPPDKKPLNAAVPLRCLLPKGVTGLLVTGLGVSAHRDAIPVIRMQADVQNQGYAAGVAAAMAARLPEERRGKIEEIDLKELQRHLVDRGVLPEECLQWEDSFPLPPETILAALDGAGADLFDTAVLLAHPEQSAAYLEERLRGPLSDEEKKNVAVVLGMMGNQTVAPILAEVIDKSEWDAGWNYRGMGQFGLSNSPLDALIVALGLTRQCQFEETLLRKIEALIRIGDQAVFSHCRAVAIAASLFKGPRLAGALETFLRLPGLSGHAVTSTLKAIESPNPDRVEDSARNRSLRELYLVKALYLCGDPNGLARELLTSYRSDLRGPYARHAAGILDAVDTESLCSGS